MRRGRVVTSWVQSTCDDDLLSPVMRGLPAGRASALALLPFNDANGALIAAIEGQAEAPPSLCAGVFAADPFHRFSDLFRLLRRCGFRRVSNWPSVGLYGPPFTEELNEKGLGFHREAKFVTQAVREGFEASATVFDDAQANAMLLAGARRLVLHPPLVDGSIMAPGAALNWAEAMRCRLEQNVEAVLYLEGEVRHRDLQADHAPRLLVFEGLPTYRTS